MANLQCGPTIGITTQEATLQGSGDSIPVNQFIRLAYANTSGGPYSNFGPSVPGDTTIDQDISFTATSLSSQSTVGATYYYVVQHLDTDGVTILDTSAECNFTTLPYFPRCEILGSDDDSIQVRVCADFVNVDQELQVVASQTPGGPYNTILATTPGTYVDDQCMDFDIPLTPCDVVYLKARVTPVPAEYVVDWQYYHGNRSGTPETVELRLGDQALYPGGQVLVDTDTVTVPATTAGAWNLRQGTFPLPFGISQLHMGFVSTFPPGSVGNFLDGGSIILRQVFPVATVIGEQLQNPSFEAPNVGPNNLGFIPEGPAPPVFWETTDPTNVLEIWQNNFLGYTAAPDGGIQFAELNANNPSELFQVVPLAVGVVDSVDECPAAVFQLECTEATNVTCDLNILLNGSYCGLPVGSWYAFQYSTSPVGPWLNQTPLRQVTVLSEPTIPVQESVTSFEHNVTYYFRLVAYGPDLDAIIGTSDVCTFESPNCCLYCGMWFDCADCFEVNTGNTVYFYCFGDVNQMFEDLAADDRPSGGNG